MMKPKAQLEKLAILLGAITLILFSTKPYILDLIQPNKSIGTLIGENAKDLINSMNGNNQSPTNSKREIWSNIITILAFVSFAFTIILSTYSIQNSTKKWYQIGGISLSIIGLGIYFSHLAIGLILLIIIGVLAVAIVVTISN